MPFLGTLFQLPEEQFLHAIPLSRGSSSVSTSNAVSPTVSVLPALPSQAPESASRKWSDAGATCITCGIGVDGPGFASAAEQRAHFKSDWHRLNVKRRLAGQPPLPEQQFETMLEQDLDEVGSISGSDSSSEEEEGPGITRANRKQAANSLPQVAFKTADGSTFAVWRSLLTAEQGKAAAALSPTALLEELQRLRTSGPLRVVVIMLRGGHFAAAVFQVPFAAAAAGSSKAASQSKQPQKIAEVLAHKTFHRYVVRAKAGGKQSTQDATGKFAKSAGSRLRRYNEAALEADVRNLLQSWKEHLDAAQLIFVQAPGSNARTIFHGDGPLLSLADPRVRKVSFTTQRPTGSEVERVLRTLLSVYQVDQQAAEPGSSTADGESTSSQAAHTSKSDTQHAEEEAGSEVHERGAPSTSPQPEEPPGPSGQPPPTQDANPLHKAAKAGDAAKVKQLLESGIDPALKDAKGKTAYALAANKDVRDTFRRFMAQYPDRWGYQAAGVPSPLTEEMEASQAAKKSNKSAKQKASQAARKQTQAHKQQEQAKAEALSFDEELARAAAEAAAISARLNNSNKNTKGAKGTGRGSARATASVSLPTPEDAAKRREKLAAAAEARMKALQLASQQQQLW